MAKLMTTKLVKLIFIVVHLQRRNSKFSPTMVNDYSIWVKSIRNSVKHTPTFNLKSSLSNATVIGQKAHAAGFDLVNLPAGTGFCML